MSTDARSRPQKAASRWIWKEHVFRLCLSLDLGQIMLVCTAGAAAEKHAVLCDPGPTTLCVNCPQDGQQCTLHSPLQKVQEKDFKNTTESGKRPTITLCQIARQFKQIIWKAGSNLEHFQLPRGLGARLEKCCRLIQGGLERRGHRWPWASRQQVVSDVDSRWDLWES